MKTASGCSNCSNSSKKKKGPGYTWMKKDKTHSGKMDTQMYPECEGTWCDRDIVKKRKSASEIELFNFVEAKKNKKVNPWAVCHTTVDKDENPEKYERCVQKVKSKQSFNLQKSIRTAVKYRVTDHPFNKTNYPDMVGKILTTPPAFARVELVKDEKVEKEKTSCKYCNKTTQMTGTKLCDQCWAIESYFKDPSSGTDKAFVMKHVKQHNPLLVEKIRKAVEQGKT